jgi:Calcineurin-like phosphoesterase
MRIATCFLLPAVAVALLCAAQRRPPADLPTGGLLSESGPTFHVADNQMPDTPAFIAYGDTRFTDPDNTRATNPRVRQYLVDQIAAQHPGAILLNGDLPLAGSNPNDYAVFRTETRIWRDEGLRLFPSLGNHEFHGDPQKALDRWWGVFPKLRNRRWYSVALGSRVYLLVLDSDASLLAGSDQARWIASQVDSLSPSVDFVIVCLHHPPVADIQEHINISHNPRPNEIALRDYLTGAARTAHASFLVIAGHIHNYERFVEEGVTYLVAGGGGAKPVFVERTRDDLYQSILFPNYHFVKLTLQKDRLRGEMFRVADPEAAQLTLERKDTFDLPVKPR